MDAIAKPERFVVLARLCMVVPAAFGAQWLLSRFAKSASTTAERKAWRVSLPFAVLLALLLVELPIHPRYIDTTPVPQEFSTLARQPAGGLMELPFATQQVETTGERMLYQTVHGKPIMAGYLSRRYDSPIIDSCSPFWGFISPLDVPREDIATPLVVNRPQDVLNFYNISYITLYEKNGGLDDAPIDPNLKTAFQDIVKTVAPSQPLYGDGYMSLFKVNSSSLDNVPPSFHVGAGWYNIERPQGTPFRWLKEGKGSLCVFTPRKVTATLQMTGISFAQDRQLIISANAGQLFSGNLRAGAINPVETAPIEWQPGMTEVQIAAMGPGVTPQSLTTTSSDSRPLTAGFYNVGLAIDAQK
jgi:hypothetical protein